MSNVTIHDPIIRTTSDGAGHVHGIAAGTGQTVDEALIGLAREARTQAEEAAREFQGPGHTDPDTAWRFEVVDVRLLAGPPDAGPESWVAYGTLTSHGSHPWDEDYWRNH
jgi:hypothetical protein